MVKPWSSSNRSLFYCSAPCLRSIGTGWNPKYVQSGSLRRFSFSLGFKSAGVAPLPPCSRKLLDETVKTFAVFPSWLHLLDGEDNCMLSVPLSTSDLHYSSWQSGEICQVLSTGAFTLLCHAFRFSLKGCSLFFSFVVLPTRRLLDVSCLLGLTLRPSAPVFCCHQDSLTRGRLAFEQEAVRASSFQSPRLVLHVMACGYWFQAAVVSSRVTEI